ncbi:LysR family transcriptional regulator, partial [Nocardia sp. JMUB6875]|uniref:LysR family transcriptional regulator n=1 Tax=Nocardia sp. JMUB6875 TaxID=3158170 RepID=UPI0034E8F240
MDLTAVRTFVVVAETGQFQEAAAELSITQQAVSKRIAALEKYLEVRLFARTARGAQLTIEGEAFLPHARDLLRVAERAEASVRPGRRALRVDVVARRIITASLLQDFHRAHPGIELDIVTVDGAVDTAVAAIEAGTIDATFHAIPAYRRLPESIRAARVIDEPHELLVGPRHPLANAPTLTPTQLSGHRICIPGLPTQGETADYYTELTTTFGFTLDPLGPVFAKESLLDELAAAPD